jgi:hypothetical protein
VRIGCDGSVVLCAGRPSVKPLASTQVMAGVSVSDCTSLHVDLSVHGGVGAPSSQLVLLEVCVFVRTEAGEIRVLGRACAPWPGLSPAGNSFLGALKLDYDAWEGAFCIRVDDSPFPMLQVCWVCDARSGRCGRCGRCVWTEVSIQSACRLVS